MPPRIAVFDVLGTVLDERSGFRAAAAAALPGPDALPFADRWLDQVSRDVSQIASARAPWRPWEQVIADALTTVTTVGAVGDDVAASSHRDEAPLRSVGRRLPAWPDSREGIQAIGSTCAVIALSNAGLGALVDSSRAAGITWDAVLSAEMVHSAKPDPQVYRFLLDQLRTDPGDVVMVAAHPWDLRAAAEHGMRTAYVDRPGEGDPEPDDAFDWAVGDLLQLAEALRR